MENEDGALSDVDRIVGDGTEEEFSEASDALRGDDQDVRVDVECELTETVGDGLVGHRLVGTWGGRVRVEGGGVRGGG